MTKISYCYYQTPAGTLRLAITDKGLTQAIFVDSQQELGQSLQPNELPPILLNGTDFQIKVWQAALRIPVGATQSYQEIADAIGHPKAVRAVANALGDNKIAYFIPCHRVLRKNGALGGYKWGIERKAKLLAAEGVSVL